MAKSRYGLNDDGSVSICRAKPENVGRYGCTHADHREMTEKEAQAVNEAAARANAMKFTATPGMKKDPKNEADKYIELVESLTKYSNNIYDDAMNTISNMEEDTRMPIHDVSEVLPNNDEIFEPKPEGVNGIAFRDRISNKEMEYLKQGGGSRPLNRDGLVGHALIGDESNMIASELGRYAARPLDRRAEAGLSVEPTPAEEHALMMLTSNPLAGRDANSDNLVNDGKIMSFGARFVINSPYMTDEQKERAFMTAPENAIESQSLPGELVNGALMDTKYGDGSKLSRQRIIRGALRHPNVSPKLAYDTLKGIQRGDEWNDRQKSDFDWQLAMNPNPDVAENIAKYDAEVDDSNKLTITKNYYGENGDDGRDGQAVGA